MSAVPSFSATHKTAAKCTIHFSSHPPSLVRALVVYAFAFALLTAPSPPRKGSPTRNTKQQQCSIPCKICPHAPDEGEGDWSAAPAFGSHHDQSRRDTCWSAEHAKRALGNTQHEFQMGRRCQSKTLGFPVSGLATEEIARTCTQQSLSQGTFKCSSERG